MAISFYKTGDAVDLAAQLIGLLESPKDQRRAAEQNYAAAIRMTMPHVVRHYLRWFELERRQRTLKFSGRRFPGLGRARASLRATLHGLPPNAARVFSTDRSEEVSADPGSDPPSDLSSDLGLDLPGKGREFTPRNGAYNSRL
jgi:hypothetical protein